MCKCSRTAASRALRLPFEESQMSRELYDCILKTAEIHNFRVNYHAKALHSKKSDCVGFIAGSFMQLLCSPILNGAADVLKPEGKILSIYPCENSREKEAEAFCEMFYTGVDSIIYIPSLQHKRPYNFSHIQKALKKHPEHPPIVTLYGGIDLPSLHQIRFNDYEVGKKAALRQLKLGCAKFGILDSSHSSPSSEERIRGYKDSLAANGIPANKIRQINILMPERAEVFDKLKGCEGLWVSHYIVLLMGSYALSHIGNTANMHVDCVSTVETDDFCNAIQPMATSHLRSPSYPLEFGSFVKHSASLVEMGKKAAEMALKAKPKDPPERKIEYMKFVSEQIK